MNKYITLAVLVISISGFAAASEVDVSPDSFSFSVIAGENYTQSIDVQWNGYEETTLYADVNLEAQDTDTEGINYTLSQNPITLDSYSSKTVDLTINTSRLLKPDNFTVEVEYSTSVYRDSGSSSDDHYEGATTGTSVNIDQGQKITNKSEEENKSEQEDDVPVKDGEIELPDNNTIEYPNSTKNNNTGQQGNTGQNNLDMILKDAVPAIIVLILLLSISGYYFYKDELIQMYQDKFGTELRDKG